MRFDRIALQKGILALSFLLWTTGVIAYYFVVHKPLLPGQLPVFLKGVQDLILALLLACLAGGLGKRLLNRRISFTPLEDLAISFALGLGILSFVGLIVGMIGLLQAWFFLVFVIAGLMILRKDVLAWIITGVRINAHSRLEKFTLAICMLLVLLNLFRSLAPPVKWDSLVYHLEIPRQYVLAGRILPLYENIYAAFPQAAEVLFAWIMTVGGPPAATTLGWVVGVIALLGTEGLARRVVGGNIRWLAPAILLSGFSISQALSWGYLELWVMLFGLGMVIALDAYGRSKQTFWVILAGLMIGFAITVKYTAGVLSLIGALVLLWEAFYKKGKIWKGTLQGKISIWLKDVLILGVVITLVVGPWLIKNWVFYGNPTYPFITLSDQVDPWRQTFHGSVPTERSFLNDLLLPFDATLFGIENNVVLGKPDYSASLGPLILAFIPGLFLGWKRFSISTRESLSRFLIMGIVTWLIWAIAAHFANELSRSRHYYGIFSALAVLSVAGFTAVTSIDLPGVRLRRVLGTMFVLALALASFAEVNYFVTSSPLPVLWGSQSNEAYITQELGAYGKAMDAVNRLPSHSTVMFLWEPRTFYCQIHCLSDGKLNTWWALRRSSGNASAISQAMRQHGITHVLINDHGLRALQGEEHIEASDLQEFMRFRSQELVFLDNVDNAYSLYQLAP